MVSAPFVSDRCTVYRTNRRVLMVALAVAAIGIAVIVLAMGLLGPQPFAALGMAMFALGLVAANAVGQHFMWPAKQPGKLQADGQGIALDGQLVLPRQKAVRGFLRDIAGQPPRVRILGLRDKILLEVETPDRRAATALLHAAHLDAEGVAARFTLTHHVLGNTWTVVGLSWLPMIVGGSAVFGVSAVVEGFGGSELVTGAASMTTLAVLALGALLLYRWSRVALVIGRDGVHLKIFGRQRYISHGQIAGVQRWPGKETSRVTPAASEGFDLVLHSGETIALRTLTQRLRHGDSQKDFIFQEAQAALESHREMEGTQLGALDRRSRAVAIWIQDLRAMGAGAQAGHRSAAVPRDDLWLVLEDPGAEVGQRAASAVALAASDDVDARERIRLLSAATANPKLQSTFEAAAGHDIAQLEKALAAIDEGGHRQGRRA
jgi:hypothetical protein